MSLNFDTGDESAFARIGRILHVAYLVTPFEASLPAAFSGINDGYNVTLQAVGGAVAVQADQLTRTASSTMAFAAQAALGVVQGMVLADAPSQGRTPQAAMAEFIRQMKAQGKTVKKNTIGLSQAALSGSVGTGVLVYSSKRGDGLVNENIIAEVPRVVCTADAYTGGATAGQEAFGLTGAPAVGNVWDYDWPGGSGAAASLAAISAAEDGNADGNLLTNGNFQSWTDDATPQLNNWTLSGGTWGTNVQQGSTSTFGGQIYVAQFDPAAANPILYQEFGDSTAGTSPTPNGLQTYFVNLWLRKLSGTISAGVLTVELTDDSGTVTQDAQGVSNSFTVTLSTLTTSYVAYNAAFRLNATPPSAVRLRLRVSTALAGASFLLANACYAPAVSAYTGGFGWQVFSGETQFVGGDGWNVTATNDQGGASYLGTFQTGFQRLFDMNGQDQLLPSSATPNISNTLITA